MDDVHQRADRYRRPPREGRRYLASVLARLHAAGIRAIRLDAVGYAIKKAGTSCFMIPETFAFIDDLTAQAHALGIEVLVEVHGHYQDQIDVARQSIGCTTSRCRRWCCTRCTRATAPRLEALARDAAAQRRHRARHARRDRRAWTRTATCSPARGDRRTGGDDSPAQPRRKPAGQRQRGWQRRHVPDQLHFLRRSRPPRR